MRGFLKMAALGWGFLMPLLGVADDRGEAVLGKTIDVKLPAQHATTALIQLSTLAGLQIVMRGHLLDSIDTPELHGRMSVGVALDRILQATPHSIQVTEGNTVTVIVPSIITTVR